MWGPSKYGGPRQYISGRNKSVPVVLRRSYGPARDDNNNNAFRSTYGVWNENYGIRCGLWDDVLFQNARNCCQTETKRRRNPSRPICTLSNTPSQQHVRYEALATPKKTGCGPNCKKSRCAATDPPSYAKPLCAADKRRRKKGARRPGSQSQYMKYTYSTMAHVQDKVLDLGWYDMTMGLKNVKKVGDPEDIQVLPIYEEPACERRCGECSDAPVGSAEKEKIEAPIEKRSGGLGSGLKSLTRTRTVGSNTEEVGDAEVDEVRVLQDVSNNNNVGVVVPDVESDLKMASPLPRLKLPTPIPRVAFLRPPKPKLKDVIEYDEERLPTPRLPTPRTPRPNWTSSPVVSLTSRRVAPQSRIPPQTQRLMPGKLAPRLFTPPATIHLSRTGSLLPRSPPPTNKSERKQPQQNKPEALQQLQPVSSPLRPLTPTPQHSTKQSSEQSSKQSAEQSSSKADSLVTSISDFENSSCSTKESSVPETLTPMFCRCSLRGKADSIIINNDSSQSKNNSAAIYRNNPLYSPGRSLTTTTDPNSSNIASSRRWRFLYTFLEIMFLVVLVGVLTVGMIPYVESVFRAYVADYCRCSVKGTGAGGPQVTADGMQNGAVKWVTCMMDDTRSTLTPLRT